MGKSRYKVLIDFLKDIKKKQGNRIDSDLFIEAFYKEIGTDHSRTLKPYLKLAKELGMLEQEVNTPYWVIKV